MHPGANESVSQLSSSPARLVVRDLGRVSRREESGSPDRGAGTLGVASHREGTPALERPLAPLAHETGTNQLRPDSPAFPRKREEPFTIRRRRSASWLAPRCFQRDGGVPHREGCAKWRTVWRTLKSLAGNVFPGLARLCTRSLVCTKCRRPAQKVGRRARPPSHFKPLLW